MIDYDKAERTIWLYGEVSDSKQDMRDGFSDTELLDVLKKLGPGELIVRINSPGGSVDTGLAIFNALKRHRGTVVTVNDSVCASIASIIFCAGAKRLVSKQSHMLLHSPHCMTAGNAGDLRSTAELLEKYESTMADIYLESMSVSAAQLTKILAAETWYNASEALRSGIATDYDDGELSYFSASKLQSVEVKGPSVKEIAEGKRRLKLAQESPTWQDEINHTKQRKRLANIGEADSHVKRRPEKLKPRTRRELEIVASNPEKHAYRMIEREREIEQQEADIRAKFPKRMADPGLILIATAARCD